MPQEKATLTDLVDLAPTSVLYKCHKCSKAHEPKSRDFRVVYGNITVGLAGGIVGNNLDDDGKVSAASVYCTSCLVDIINQRDY